MVVTREKRYACEEKLVGCCVCVYGVVCILYAHHDLAEAKVSPFTNHHVMDIMRYIEAHDVRE